MLLSSSSCSSSSYLQVFHQYIGHIYNIDVDHFKNIYELVDY